MREPRRARAPRPRPGNAIPANPRACKGRTSLSHPSTGCEAQPEPSFVCLREDPGTISDRGPDFGSPAVVRGSFFASVRPVTLRPPLSRGVPFRGSWGDASLSTYPHMCSYRQRLGHPLEPFRANGLPRLVCGPHVAVVVSIARRAFQGKTPLRAGRVSLRCYAGGGVWPRPQAFRPCPASPGPWSCGRRRQDQWQRCLGSRNDLANAVLHGQPQASTSRSRRVDDARHARGLDTHYGVAGFPAGREVAIRAGSRRPYRWQGRPQSSHEDSLSAP